MKCFASRESLLGLEVRVRVSLGTFKLSKNFNFFSCPANSTVQWKQIPTKKKDFLREIGRCQGWYRDQVWSGLIRSQFQVRSENETTSPNFQIHLLQRFDRSPDDSGLSEQTGLLEVWWEVLLRSKIFCRFLDWIRAGLRAETQVYSGHFQTLKNL